MSNPYRALRFALGLLACGVVAWSFGRVLNRALESPSLDGPKTELVVMHWSGEGGQEEDAIAEELLADFEAENPDIQVRRINPGDAGSFYTKLQTMAAGGTPPDVFYVGSERLPAFASMGLIAPVNESAIDLSDFYPATLDAFRFDGTASGQGTLYGIPKDFTTMGFYANRSLFEQAGLPWPKDDWTWNEFIQTASALGGLEGITGAEFVTWPMMVRLYLRTWGLDLVSPDFKTLRLKDPAVVEALSRLRNWRHDRTNFPNALTSGKSKVATGASVFLTGKVGMAGPFGRWVVPSYRKIPSPESGGFDWDFLPLPRAEGHPPRNAIATVAWCVSSKTKHPASAQALVEHLCGPKGQSLAAPLGLAVPTRKSVANSPAFLDSKTPPFRDDLFLSQAENAAAIAWPSDSRFEAQLNWRLSSALQSGDSTLEEASSAFEQDWELVASSPLARTDFPDMPWDRIRAWVTTLIALLLAIGALRWWRGRPGKLEAQEERWGLALLSPWVLGFLLFMAFPIGLSLLLSFSKWNGVSELGTASYVGLANYSQLLSHDGRFLTSLRVTAWYSLLAVPLGQLAALGAALLMNSKVRGIGFFRAAWYLPSVLAGVGISVLWRWVFDGDHGLMNSGLNAVLHSPLLSWAGLSAPEWFGADAAIWGPPAFVIMSLWAVGGPMMIYLAGLQGISQDLYEAAEIDGAGRWARFRHVTLPMLSPIIFFNTIMAVIGSFQVFTQAFVMTGGEPGDLTRFFVLYLFNQAFEFYEMGYASSMAWILLLVTLVLTLILMKGSKRFVHYEALQG